MLWEKERWRC